MFWISSLLFFLGSHYFPELSPGLGRARLWPTLDLVLVRYLFALRHQPTFLAICGHPSQSRVGRTIHPAGGPISRIQPCQLCGNIAFCARSPTTRDPGPKALGLSEPYARGEVSFWSFRWSKCVTPVNSVVWIRALDRVLSPSHIFGYHTQSHKLGRHIWLRAPAQTKDSALDLPTSAEPTRLGYLALQTRAARVVYKLRSEGACLRSLSPQRSSRPRRQPLLLPTIDLDLGLHLGLNVTTPPPPSFRCANRHVERQNQDRPWPGQILQHQAPEQ